MVVGGKRERMQMFVLVILLSDQIFFIDTDQIIDDSGPPAPPQSCDSPKYYLI